LQQATLLHQPLTLDLAITTPMRANQLSCRVMGNESTYLVTSKSAIKPGLAMFLKWARSGRTGVMILS